MSQKKLKYIIFFVVLFLIASLWLGAFRDLKFDEGDLIVWSVGQGQMLTYLTKEKCYHFDMGGERFPKSKLFRTCKNKNNKVYYTHWDTDHINFSLSAKKIFPSLCRMPSGRKLPKSYRKKRMLKKIPECASHTIPDIKKIHHPRILSAKNSNDSSRIFVVKGKALIPGDSSRKMEKYWGPLIKDPIKVLVMGHHGSFSSTSSFLLRHLPQLKLSIASARKKRYGHPHKKVVRRLNRRGVLVLSTEDFGHIRIPLSKNSPRPIFF